nr:reverse transcriptase domain-containing protein [Tanacetum cinerariifolium]
DSSVSRLKVISCIKARKYIKSGSQLFIAQVTEKEPAKKQLQDVPVICNFPVVFHDDLPGLPLPRQVEFKIELIPDVAPVARAPYRYHQLRIIEEDIPITAFQTRVNLERVQMAPDGKAHAQQVQRRIIPSIGLTILSVRMVPDGKVYAQQVQRQESYKSLARLAVVSSLVLSPSLEL